MLSTKRTARQLSQSSSQGQDQDLLFPQRLKKQTSEVKQILNQNNFTFGMRLGDKKQDQNYSNSVSVSQSSDAIKEEKAIQRKVSFFDLNKVTKFYIGRNFKLPSTNSENKNNHLKNQKGNTLEEKKKSKILLDYTQRGKLILNFGIYVVAYLLVSILMYTNFNDFKESSKCGIGNLFLNRNYLIPLTLSLIHYSKYMLIKRLGGLQSIIQLLFDLISIALTLEEEIIRSPIAFKFPIYYIAILFGNEVSSFILNTSRPQKCICNIFSWAYLVERIYIHYGYYDIEIIILGILHSTLSDYLLVYIKIHIEQIQKINILESDKRRKSFLGTLQKMPFGVLTIDNKSLQINFINNEIRKNFGIKESNYYQDELIQKLGKMTQVKFIQIQKNTKNFPEQGSSQPDLMQEKQSDDGLWNFLINQQFAYPSSKSHVFETQVPQHMQFEVIAFENKENQEKIVFFFDHSQSLEQPAKGQQNELKLIPMVASEQMTIFSNIIPITKILQTAVTESQACRLIKYIDTISLIIQNIEKEQVEQEHNEDELTFEQFNIRDCLDEVISIVNFQKDAQKFPIKQDVEFSVPQMIKIDKISYQRILFNLIAQAMKQHTNNKGISVSLSIEKRKFITSIRAEDVDISSQDNQNEHVGRQEKDFDFIGTNLSVCQRLAQKLQGEFTHQWNQNFGCSLTINLSNLNNYCNATIEEMQSIPSQEYCQINNSPDGSFQHFNPLVKPQKQQQLENQDNKTFSLERHQNNNKTPKILSRFSKTAKEEKKKNLSYQRNSPNFESLNPLHDNIDSDIDHIEHNFNESSIINVNHCTNLKNINQRSSSHFNLKQNNNVSEVEMHPRPKDSTQNVLIVDDSLYNQFVMKEIMNGIFVEEKGRYNIDTALNGQEAIEQYLLKNENLTSGSKTSKYDIIFLDLNMPIMDGYQTIEHLRSYERELKLDLSKTKIIAHSAITNAQFLKNPLSKLFEFFLEKPINLNSFRDLLQNI